MISDNAYFFRPPCISCDHTTMKRSSQQFVTWFRFYCRTWLLLRNNEKLSLYDFCHFSATTSFDFFCSSASSINVSSSQIVQYFTCTLCQHTIDKSIYNTQMRRANLLPRLFADPDRVFRLMCAIPNTKIRKFSTTLPHYSTNPTWRQ